ncbi:crossover junction endonuclease MUS81 [Neocloeon triangulifer]|uniref:crossover junction endonuclease MUS81 n=1 Tax=Neocloeon triangulifer TaxID=2078957 RepID=UPI00286F1B3B|nr:crossover junction endonuclease MUS81 [Neocloeon triangulifer]
MGEPSVPVKRRKVTYKRPNALFEKWLGEWKDEAKEKGWQIAYSYQKALQSLKKYPTPLKSGKQCNMLKSFGPALCSKLDKKIKEYIAENPDDTRFSTEDPLPKATKPTSPKKKKAAGNSPKKRKPAAKKNKKNHDDEDEDMDDDDLQPAPVVFIPPGNAQVKLIVDCSETNMTTKKASQKNAMKELQAQKIAFEIRDLSVGDFMWLAVAPNGSELVLPYIVERKRSDDLAQSIKGDRYHEQKMRLNACGLNVIYLFEDTKSYIGFREESLYQAQMNTNIQSKFCVHTTGSVKETVSYLASLTRVLEKKIRNKCIKSCSSDDEPQYSLNGRSLCLPSYKEFKQGSAKIENFTVREMFAQLLLQISGTSCDAVCAIVEKYPTLSHMREAFGRCDSLFEKIGLLTVLQYGSSRMSLPHTVAKKIVQFFTASDFSEL